MSGTTYMLDTNIASAIIKNTSPNITKRLLSVPIKNLFISAITEAELLYGIAQKPEATRLADLVHEFLKRVQSLPWGTASASAYAEFRCECKRQGKSLGNLDMLIAAHALSTEMTLVTNDKAFFQFDEMMPLQDWS